MTKNFKKQQRENERPYSRNSSSSRYGEERSPRPAKPRLSRDMVDRGWENGARRDHPDYHARSNHGQPTGNNRRHTSDQPSAQNSRKPYGNRQDTYRYPERTPNNNGTRPRSFEPGSRNFDDHSYGDYPHRSGPRPGYRGRNQNRDSQRREVDRDRRQSREFEHETHTPRSFDGDYEQRDKRPYRNRTQHDTQNPRWQSRPARQPGTASRRPRASTPQGPEDERFEGDYEGLDAYNAPTEAKPEPQPKPPTSASPRGRKTKKSASRPPSTALRPSQRGFKWPTPEG